MEDDSLAVVPLGLGPQWAVESRKKNKKKEETATFAQ